MKKYLFLLSTLTLLSCATSKDVNQAESTTNQASNPSNQPSLDNTQCDNPNPQSSLLRMASRQTVDASVQQMFQNQAARGQSTWGKDGYIQSDKHRFVKYLDSFKTRADIHFDTGKIFVSTIDDKDSIEKLKNAIVQVVLLPPNPEHIDLTGADAVQLSKTPFFLGQILDKNGKPMDTMAKAKAFAEHMVANKLQEKKFPVGSAKYVQIDLVKDHEEIRKYEFSEYVKIAAKRYNISEELIYAVIRTESSFNPYAVSHAGAIGLMQVMPKTAGADVFKLIKNKEGVPTKDYLFDPANNIDTGVAYLSILQDRYLKDVVHPASRHFSIISAYNGGTGNVLMSFDNDRKVAMERLNATHPRQVYCVLTKHHPKEESRHYLNKVLKFQHNFNINDV